MSLPGPTHRAHGGRGGPDPCSRSNLRETIVHHLFRRFWLSLLGLLLVPWAQAASLRFGVSALTPAAQPVVEVTVSGVSVFNGPTSGFTIPVNTTGEVVIRIRSLPDYQAFDGWTGVCAGRAASLPCEFSAGQPVEYVAGAVIRNRTGTLRFQVRSVDMVAAPSAVALDRTRSPDGSTDQLTLATSSGAATVTALVGAHAFTVLPPTTGNCIQAPLVADIATTVQEGQESLLALAFRGDRCAVAVDADAQTQGIVTSVPPGIDCPFGPVNAQTGSNCAAFFPFQSSASLSPAPKPGSVFGGWASGCRPALQRRCEAVAQPSVSAKRPSFVAASGSTADLAIDASGLRVSDAGSGRLAFSVTVRNTGTGIATAVKLELGALQPGALAEIPSIVSDGGSCDALQFCRWTLGDLAAGQSRTVSFTAAGTRSDFALTACTLGTSADPEPANDCASATVSTGASPPPTPGPATVSIGTRTPVDATVVRGSTDVPALQFTVRPPAGIATGYTLTGIAVSVSGSGQDALDLTAVRLFADDNGNGVVDPGEKAVPLASGRFDADDGTLRLALAPTDVQAGRSFIVALDVNTTLAASPAPAALAGLAAYLTAGWRRRRSAAAVAAAAVLVVACGGGSTPSPPPLTRSYRIVLLEANVSAQGQAVTVNGLPFAGAQLTVEK